MEACASGSPDDLDQKFLLASCFVSILGGGFHLRLLSPGSSVFLRQAGRRGFRSVAPQASLQGEAAIVLRRDSVFSGVQKVEMEGH